MAGTLSTKGLDTRPNPPYTPILLRHNNPALTHRHPSRFSTTRQVRGITAGKSQNTSIHNYSPLTPVHYTLSRCFYTCVSSSKRLLHAIHPSKLWSTSILLSHRSLTYVFIILFSNPPSSILAMCPIHLQRRESTLYFNLLTMRVQIRTTSFMILYLSSLPQCPSSI